jgi:osmotically-inducible protein OsmY
MSEGEAAMTTKYDRFGHEEEFDRERWDREHWEEWMNTVRSNQRARDWSYGSVGGSPYDGGVFSPGSYGGGAEFYSVTGMYENPLLEAKHRTHAGKGPKGYQRSDDRIHDEICDRLTHHPLVDASTMDVHVKNGEVTLTGEVTNRRMKFMAEDVVDQVSGVREIHNQLRVYRDRAA